MGYRKISNRISQTIDFWNIDRYYFLKFSFEGVLSIFFKKKVFCGNDGVSVGIFVFFWFLNFFLKFPASSFFLYFYRWCNSDRALKSH